MLNCRIIKSCGNRDSRLSKVVGVGNVWKILLQMILLMVSLVTGTRGRNSWGNLHWTDCIIQEQFSSYREWRRNHEVVKCRTGSLQAAGGRTSCIIISHLKQTQNQLTLCTTWAQQVKACMETFLYCWSFTCQEGFFKKSVGALIRMQPGIQCLKWYSPKLSYSM